MTSFVACATFLLSLNALLITGVIGEAVSNNIERTVAPIAPITNIETLLQTVKEHSGQRIFVQYIGTLLPDGHNWCPDSERAKPIIMDSLKYLPAKSVFLTVWVGDRPTWKNANNVFRKHPLCKISSIPTLVEFNTTRRLSGDDILNEDLIKKLYQGN